MGKYFVNFSNHPSKYWSKKQIDEAEKFGEIIDVEFPKVSPFDSYDEIKTKSKKWCDVIMSHDPAVVMCQGEFTLCYEVISLLKKREVSCVAACSERKAIEKILKDGTIEKTAIFNFIGFREY